MTAPGRMLALAAVLLSLGSCQEAQEVAPRAAEDQPFFGGWAAVRERGVLRLVRRSWAGFDTLPSQGLSAESYRRIAEDFAARHGLAVRWSQARSIRGLLSAVAEGRADIAVGNITVTAARQQEVAFSLPLTRSREWVVGVDEGGRFAVAEHTAYADSLAEHYPEAVRVPVPGDADPEAFLDLLESGAIDATIMDEAVARALVRSSPKVAKLRELADVKAHAWALRKDAAELKAALDDYLLERHLLDDRAEELRDWQAIVDAGRLRMLTVNSATTYYLWRGELLGFDYELMDAFAKANDLALEVIVASGIDQLFAWLQAGRGDVVAAGLTRLPEREAMGVAFASPYLEIRETFVTAGAPIVDFDGLRGRRVTVNPHTSYAVSLASLGDAGFTVDYAERSTEAILDGVAAGELDATLADSHRAKLAATFSSNLALGLDVGKKGLAWAVRREQPELLRRLDEYAREGYRGYQFNVLFNKYFVNQRRMTRQREQRITGGLLSPFDGIVKPFAAAANIDWRLVVAQMYQESGFQPDRVSFAGARGLLQVLPRTAVEVGVDPERLAEPEEGIRAGVEYLAWTRERFPELPPGEQLLFALAAYNAGAGHVRDGRRLAARLGLDGSLWFDNVERAMLKLAEPEYAAQALHGYVRGTEVVRYVREINDRYRAYLDHFRGLGEVDEAG